MKTEKLAHWAEIISSLVVVLTLVFLIHEVRENTKALDRQSDLDRSASLTAPFFEAPELASISAKIKAVDGPDPFPQALVDRYDLPYNEAVLWERHLWEVWSVLEAQFEFSGATQEAIDLASILLTTADNVLYIESWGSEFFETEFGAFVGSLADDLGIEIRSS